MAQSPCEIRASSESLSTIVAERVTTAAELVGDGLTNDIGSIDTNTIVDGLREGRVDTLLVHDDATSGHEANPTRLDGARLVDRPIVTALATDAEIFVVSDSAMMGGPLAATMRW